MLRKTAAGMENLRFNYKEVLNDETRREPLQLQSGRHHHREVRL